MNPLYVPPHGSEVETDTVEITAVTYNAGSKTLLIVATSSAQPTVSLIAVGYGILSWNASTSTYRRTFLNVLSKPATVTVNSTGGGTDTAPPPAY